MKEHEPSSVIYVHPPLRNTTLRVAQDSATIAAFNVTPLALCNQDTHNEQEDDN
jgi:hypothetical protein